MSARDILVGIWVFIVFICYLFMLISAKKEDKNRMIMYFISLIFAIVVLIYYVQVR